jgi:hypothetical protein
MKSIYKYVLNIEDEPSILMPMGAQILSVDAQMDPSRVGDHEQLCLWALVDPEAIPEGRHFRIYGTGHPVEEADLANSRFIGTVPMMNGSLIWHVFEKVWLGIPLENVERLN